MQKRLWEVEHNYYCAESNYFNNECGDHFKSFADFIAEYGDADMALNLVFRWDWCEGEDHDLPEHNGDDYYRNGKLKIFWMGQRKGLYRFTTIEVCRADEPAVIEFLWPRYEYLVSLWSPLSNPASSQSPQPSPGSKT